MAVCTKCRATYDPADVWYPSIPRCPDCWCDAILGTIPPPVPRDPVYVPPDRRVSYERTPHQPGTCHRKLTVHHRTGG